MRDIKAEVLIYLWSQVCGRCAGRSLECERSGLVKLRKLTDVAVQAISSFPSEELLNDARDKVMHAVYDLIRGQLTQEKIDNAKGAIGVWTLRLRLTRAASSSWMTIPPAMKAPSIADYFANQTYWNLLVTTNAV